MRSQVPGVVCAQALHPPHTVAPQAEPVMVAGTQACISVDIIVAHVPLPHVGLVLSRVCVPEVAHAAPTMQTDQGPVVGIPQGVPSVLGRTQPCDSVPSTDEHTPPLQVEVVVVRACVPICVQGSVPKSHVDQLPYVGAAHMVPSVDGRVHASDPVVVAGVHAPL